MQVGTLVQWTGMGEDNGSIGIVFQHDEKGFRVKWIDGVVVTYTFHAEYIRVLCK